MHSSFYPINVGVLFSYSFFFVCFCFAISFAAFPPLALQPFVVLLSFTLNAVFYQRLPPLSFITSYFHVSLSFSAISSLYFFFFPSLPLYRWGDPHITLHELLRGNQALPNQSVVISHLFFLLLVPFHCTIYWCLCFEPLDPITLFSSISNHFLNIFDFLKIEKLWLGVIFHINLNKHLKYITLCAANHEFYFLN